MKRGEAAAREDAYKMLGVLPPFTDQELKAKFKTLAKQHHPDKGGDHDTFVKLLAAFELLLPDCGKHVHVIQGPLRTEEGVLIETLGGGLKVSAVKCTACRGAGYLSQKEHLDCPSCTIRVGHYRLRTGFPSRCRSCEGAGFIEGRLRRYVCTTCKGHGEVALFNPLFIKGGLTQKERKRGSY